MTLKRDYFMNILRLGTGMLFPFFFMRPFAQALGAEGYGAVQMAENLSGYFVLLGTLGIPQYAVRETAKSRALGGKEFENCIGELAMISILLSGGSFLLYLFIVPWMDNKLLYLAFAFQILLIPLNMDWYFTGLEEQEYLTKRNLLIKLSVILMTALLLKDRGAMILYPLILVLGNLLGMGMGMKRMGKSLLIKLQNIDLKKAVSHLMPLVIFSLETVAYSVYTYLDILMLGRMAGNEEVGYYSAAMKVIKSGNAVVTAMALVAIPKVTSALARADWKSYEQLRKNTIIYTAAAGALFTALGMLYSGKILFLAAGRGYEPAAEILKVLSPSVFLVGLSVYVGMVYLQPKGLEKITTLAVCLGAAANFILNLIFIPQYKGIGAAYTTVISEIINLSTMIILISIKNINKKHKKNRNETVKPLKKR